MPGLDDLTKPDDASAADSLVAPSAPKGGSSLIDLTGNDTKTLGALTGMKREQIAESNKGREEAASLLDRDQKRVEQQYEASGYKSGDFQPWNAAAEHEKHSTDPLVAFGSLGSVFGMIASAFTHAPMENALNASAAAMNAIKEGDEKEYERAHEAWKQNTDLAFKRHQMQREGYQDAITLMNTNQQVGDAKARMLAAKYGDAQSLLLLEAGMSKEWIDLQEKRNDAIVKAVDASERVTKFSMQKRFFEEASKAVDQEPDPVKKAGTKLYNFEKIFNNKMDTPQKEVMGLWFKQHPNATAEEAAEFFRTKVERPLGGQQGADQEFIRRFREQNPDATDKEFAEQYDAFKKGQRNEPRKNADQEFISKFYADHPDATSEEFTEAFGKFKKGQKAPTGAGGTGSLSGQHAQTLAGLKDDVRKEHPDWSEGQVGAEAEHRQKQAQTTVSGNKQLELQGRIDKFDHSEQIVDKTLKVLENHTGSAGIAGKVMRLEERVSNLLGSKSTDRVQMMRDIELLRGWGKELLFSKNEKLKAEASRIDSIVGGTSAGDTGPNTVRALKDLKKLYEQMKQEEEAKLKGTWKPSEEREPSAPKPAGGNKSAPWARDPIEKRSDLGSDQEAA